MKTNKDDDIPLDDLEIDKYNLDEEWVRQPVLYHHWATRLADARHDYDEAKHNVEVVEAEMDYDIRQHPAKYSIDKITEAVVERGVKRTLEYQHAVEDMLRAKHRVGRLEATVSSLDHRKKGLEKEVDLTLADYFSTPRPQSKPARDHKEEQERKEVFGRRR